MKTGKGLALLVVLLLGTVPLLGGTAQTAFSRAPTWVYEFLAVDLPGADDTRVEGINNRNDIVGMVHMESGSTNQGFLQAGGVLTQFSVPGASSTIPSDINDAGDIVGRCDNCNPPGGPTGTRGFLYSGGTFAVGPFEPVFRVEMARTTGVTRQGHLVGWFDEFLLDPPFGGTIRRSSYVNGVYVPGVTLSGVNDAGHVVGWGFFPDGSLGSFLTAGTTTTRINLPFGGDQVPEVEDVNNLDTVVGSYLHEDSPTGVAFRGFVWSNGKAVSINYPGAFTTEVRGINDAGILVGTYGNDGAPRSHGFVAVPRSPVTLTVNGAAGPATIVRTQSLRVDVAFQAPPDGPLNPAELYVGVATPYGVFWLSTSGRFVSTPTRAFAGALPGFGPVPALQLANASLFAAGTYTWFAIVDDDTNGVPNGAFFDLAQITIR